MSTLREKGTPVEQEYATNAGPGQPATRNYPNQTPENDIMLEYYRNQYADRAYYIDEKARVHIRKARERAQDPLMQDPRDPG